LDRSQVLACIDAAAELGLESIEFTGGEIFLFFKDLISFMTHAHDRGLHVFLNTNAFWATAPGPARQRLAGLKARGLRKIILSADRYHQKFIPLEHVVTALDAAAALEIPAAVTICHVGNDPSLLDTVAVLRHHTREIKLQPVAPFGRARGLAREEMARCSYSTAGLPCEGIFAPTVSPDGRVSLCCAPPMWLPVEDLEGSPLVLGWLDREPLTQILTRAERDPFLALLAAEGLGGIVGRLNALAPDLYRPRAEGYFGPCDLCVEVLGSRPLAARVGALLPVLVTEARRSHAYTSL
jgi:hypothetical protein